MFSIEYVGQTNAVEIEYAETPAGGKREKINVIKQFFIER